MVSRRGFLKLLGGAGAAVVAAPLITPQTVLAVPPTAPLFVPAQNLDMGVPRRILTATEMPKAPPPLMIPEDVQREIIESVTSRTIPMLLLQDNFIKQYGGKLKAGHEIMVDRETADRWVRNGVAAPAPNAPRDLQAQSAKRMAERQQKRQDVLRGVRWEDTTIESRLLAIDGAVLSEKPKVLGAGPIDTVSSPWFPRRSRG